MTWGVIAALKAVGLVSDVKLPSAAALASKRFPEPAPAA
jgi:hypothetical protein